ncbi:MAG: DUF4097 family beta strand repeat protein [Oscillospiraceae bacterium]|nr:DUF4097 family beta strand repeat protein [Oscillospiraceae bacterium]
MHKTWLIIAAVIILVGAALFTAMLAKSNWDFANLSTAEFQTETYTSQSPITNISIDSTTADITFCLSETDSVKVVCYEMEKAPHNVRFDEGNLTIEEDDQRKWYDHIGINFSTPKITVYLPKSECGTLEIDLTTGDVSIPSDFTFESITVKGTTCDATVNASVIDSLTVKTTTGDVNISNAEFGTVSLLATTGDMTLTNVKSKIIYTSGSTGDICLENVIVEKNLNITRTTGDVRFKDSDAGSILIQLTTGDVTGNLLTGKIFSVKTGTGKISIPENTPGSTCVITTGTGDIRISVTNSETKS